MTHTAKILSAAALAALAFLSAGVAAARPAGPDYARVRSISYAGTGCPAGTIQGRFGSDLTSFSLESDDFVAEAGPGVALSASRKNCQIMLNVDFPAGWSFAVAEVDYRGYVALDRGVSATQTSAYYFQGQSTSARLSTTLTGPTFASYRIKDTLGISAYVWSPCGLSRALVINAQARVDNTRNRSGDGVITVDRVSGRLAQVYGLSWKRCN